MLYRILCRCDDDVAQWAVDKDIQHDTAGKGKSALSAALFRALLAEMSLELGVEVGACFFDFQARTCGAWRNLSMPFGVDSHSIWSWYRVAEVPWPKAFRLYRKY